MAPNLTTRSALGHLAVMLAGAVALGLLVGGLALPFAGVVGITGQKISKSLDELPAELVAQPLAQQTQVLANDGTLLATWFDQNRVNVTLDQVAPIMREAILSIEDARFYQHGALDVKGTLRAFITNQANNGVVQGGSSITQQMVKMTLLLQGTPEQRKAATQDSYERKITELRYAIAFEQNYSKQWILERYLNIAYFGDGAWGIESAARHYFNTTAAKLTLNQAALLAGLVKNPTQYDPTDYPTNAKSRRDVVLNRMAELKVIGADEADQAKATDLGLDVQQTSNGCISALNGNASWFCDYLRNYLLDDPQLGATVDDREHLIDAGGLTIHTTLDPRFQIAAQSAVSKHVNPTDNAIGGMAMVVPGTGEVRALAQSRPMGTDKAAGQTFLDYVVPPEYGDSKGFQAGSTFKVFVLSAAIRAGIPLNTSIYAPSTFTVEGNTLSDCPDKPQGWSDWKVSNDGGGGTYNLYTGTRNSINTFYAQLEQRTGLCDPITIANEMGVNVPDKDPNGKPPGDHVGPFTLGVTSTNPLTMASVYAMFGARGMWCEPRPVDNITDSAGRTVATYPNKCKRILEEGQADAVNDILRGVIAPGGFAAAQQLSIPAAGKTGTIQSNMAVWFDGYTPTLATAAMIAGADDNGLWVTLNGQTVGGKRIGQAFGASVAAPMWGDAMKAIVRYLPNQDFVKPPADVVNGHTAKVPSVGGMSPSDAVATLQAAGFKSSVVSKQVSSSYAKGKVAYTDPRGETQAATGTTILIYVSNGVPPAPDPAEQPTTPQSDTNNGGNGNGPGNFGNGNSGNGNGLGGGNGFGNH